MKATIEVPDDFEPGDCYGCPLHYSYSDYENDWDYDVCVLDADYEHCPVEVERKKDT